VGHLQVKNVPDVTYAALRARAASEGVTIRDYVLKLVEHDLARPNLREWLHQVEANRPTMHVTVDQVIAAIDADRDERENRTW
jgi:plasmid stability protein